MHMATYVVFNEFWTQQIRIEIGSKTWKIQMIVFFIGCMHMPTVKYYLVMNQILNPVVKSIQQHRRYWLNISKSLGQQISWLVMGVPWALLSKQYGSTQQPNS